MPYRNQATVQRWVDDYLAENPEQSGSVTVLEKDFTPGPDSGMVVVSLSNADTVTYIQAAVTDGLPNWLVTFEARSEGFDLDGAGVHRLASDLFTIAGLCDYLQRRTEAAMAAIARGDVASQPLG
ncbi:protein-L-isoaspartate carboxylmethyltransferase [Microbacterium aurum]